MITQQRIRQQRYLGALPGQERLAGTSRTEHNTKAPEAESPGIRRGRSAALSASLAGIRRARHPGLGPFIMTGRSSRR
jgi:hypothetical protein